MLILSRKTSQRLNVYVDGKFVGFININEVNRNKVSIGLELDKTVKIVRSEIDNNPSLS